MLVIDLNAIYIYIYINVYNIKSPKLSQTLAGLLLVDAYIVKLLKLDQIIGTQGYTAVIINFKYRYQYFGRNKPRRHKGLQKNTGVRSSNDYVRKKCDIFQKKV